MSFSQAKFGRLCRPGDLLTSRLPEVTSILFIIKGVFEMGYDQKRILRPRVARVRHHMRRRHTEETGIKDYIEIYQRCAALFANLQHKLIL
ncbi:MAG: hypothetical protein A2928_02350 [Candidatus Taylorbacteria bacterium RIFCSPLOWO2_01_FULL_45_15b]|uniref:Uncharacterized protein n=1 Tax=Candidatus Taylorbacteria bacterium RIFCSPLOWO2_01_FULL_45_15b TaxID=1802319 RepID=A0A1G2NFV3_9BACT|nr:MAG: hypothetical protein A2928_02350 [Candidatus Taylorbacteria bacterium RIFCSPLOWO2_01_FULL_45_15b]